MKTRIIKTRIWSNDDTFVELSPNAKYLFLYFITNERIGMTGIYECPERIILFETGLNKKTYASALEELVHLDRVRLSGSWIFVVNAEKHNNYKNGAKNLKAYENEISAIPRDIKEKLDSTIEKDDGTPIVPIIQKPEIRNKNTENKYDLIFLDFWNQYPRKVAKEKAWQSWSRLNDIDRRAVISTLPSHISSDQWQKDGGQFIPHPATWLNQRRWEDELETSTKLNLDNY